MNGIKINGNLVFPEQAEFPLNPKGGTTCFKDGILWIYSKIGGLLTWYPTNRLPSAWTHNQSTPADEWIVDHGLDTEDLLIQVYNSDNKPEFADHQIIDSDTVKVRLTESMTGRCVIFGAKDISVPSVVATNIDVSGDIKVQGNSVITTGDSVDLGTL